LSKLVRLEFLKVSSSNAPSYPNDWVKTIYKTDILFTSLNKFLLVNNNNNNYDNLYGAVMWPYNYMGALQATTLGKP